MLHTTFLITDGGTHLCNVVINARGVPNSVKIWLRRNLATTLASLVLVGIASTHLET